MCADRQCFLASSNDLENVGMMTTSVCTPTTPTTTSNTTSSVSLSPSTADQLPATCIDFCQTLTLILVKQLADNLRQYCAHQQLCPSERALRDVYMLVTAQLKHSLLDELRHWGSSSMDANTSAGAHPSASEINLIYEFGLQPPSNSEHKDNNNNQNNELNNTLWQVLNSRDSYIETSNLIRCQMEGQPSKSSYRTLLKRLSLRKVSKGW